MSQSMQATQESTVAPKLIGWKCKLQAIKEIVSEKPSKRQPKRKTRQVSFVDEDDEVMISDNRNDDTMMLEDIGKSSDVNNQENTYVPTMTLIPVQNEDPIVVQTDKDVNHKIMKVPIINIFQSQSQSPMVPPLNPLTTTTPMSSTTIQIPTTTILIQTIFQTPPTSLTGISNPVPPTIFTESTTDTKTNQPPLIQKEDHVSDDNDEFSVPNDDDVY